MVSLLIIQLNKVGIQLILHLGLIPLFHYIIVTSDPGVNQQGSPQICFFLLFDDEILKERSLRWVLFIVFMLFFSFLKQWKCVYFIIFKNAFSKTINFFIKETQNKCCFGCFQPKQSLNLRHRKHNLFFMFWL